MGFLFPPISAMRASTANFRPLVVDAFCHGVPTSKTIRMRAMRAMKMRQ